jgi:hypothetical protein
MALNQSLTVMRAAALAAVAYAALAASANAARAEDKLLAEAVDFTGTFIFLQAKTPALVIGVIRNGETGVRGYGEIADGTGKARRRHADAYRIDYQGVLRRDARKHGRRWQGQFHRPAAGSAWLGRED